MLKESKLNGTSGNYDEAVSSLKSELALRDEENDRLKVTWEEKKEDRMKWTHCVIAFRNNFTKPDYKPDVNNSLWCRHGTTLLVIQERTW
jgi:hypothetical protein